MKTPDIIITYPNSDDKFEALKAFLKALKIKFEIAKGDVDIALDQDQKDILDERRLKAKDKNFISVEEANIRLRNKYGI